MTSKVVIITRRYIISFAVRENISLICPQCGKIADVGARVIRNTSNTRGDNRKVRHYCLNCFYSEPREMEQEAVAIA